jgi:hypothetical protein
MRNFKNLFHRSMANYLRKRGWVVFYLEEQARECHDDCWLKIYLATEKLKVIKQNKKTKNTDDKLNHNRKFSVI